MPESRQLYESKHPLTGKYENKTLKLSLGEFFERKQIQNIIYLYISLYIRALT